MDDLKTLRGYEAADLEAISAYGYRLYQYGRFLDAEVIFDGLLAVDPGNAYAAQALAAVRLQLGDYDGALKALNHSIVRHPRAFVPYVLRAQCMMALGHLKRAVSDLDRAEKLGRRVSREAPEWTMVEALRERLALG